MQKARSDCYIKGEIERTKRTFRGWKCGSRNYLKKDIENKVEKNLPERRVKRKRDGIWEIETI